ncbi:MAG: hypothetical protein KDC33_06930 [Thermoleophilia bacterium]|nr:hypothetical protein [Thermoleophilia bacterium]
MIRDELAGDPTLAARLRPEAAPAILSPAAGGRLDRAQATGLDLILEGFLAHHGTPRHLSPAPDRHVLAGDYCYAAGLVRVADAGDVEVIRVLADLVARSAGLVADGPDVLPPLWRAAMEAIADPGAGGIAAFDSALDALDAGDDAPLRTLGARAAARGLDEALA